MADVTPTRGAGGGHPTREPAPLGGRFAAAVTDWLLVAFAGFVLLAALPQLFFSASGGNAEAGMAGFALVPVVLMLVVAGYFGLSWTCGGRTVGMLVLSLRLVESRTGHAPRPVRALARTGVTLATFVGVVVLLVLVEAASPDEEVAFTDGHFAALAGAAAVTALALAGHLTALVDAGGRTLQDRLLGLSVERVPDADPRSASDPS